MKIKKQIKESITSSAISPISYIILIDSANIIGKGRGFLTYIFPTESSSTFKIWFRKMQSSDSYKETKEKLKSLASRFDGNPSLITLCKTLERLKKMTFAESDKESHEKDIEKLISKISVFIKRRLTEEDDALLEKVLSEINNVAEKISKKMDDELESAMQKTVKSEPDVSKSEESEKQKTEIKVNERVKNKLRKKIKEIIRTHLFNNR